jgi:hypothetical protein
MTFCSKDRTLLIGGPSKVLAHHGSSCQLTPKALPAQDMHNWPICAPNSLPGTRLRRVQTRQGAISQAGGARRPLTHCDSYPLPGMLLSACSSRELHAVGVLVP